MSSRWKKLNKSVVFLAFTVLGVFLLNLSAKSQQKADEPKVVDKIVATVSDGVRTELITYSDLIWQLALNPRVAIHPPSSENLNRALQVIIKFRLVALEAERLPSQAPTRKEIDAEIMRVLNLFPSTADFVKRLNAVGFESIIDDNFQDMMRKRVAIEKYTDFRFRSFVVITPEDEKKYYERVFVPTFKRNNPGVIVPKLSEIRRRINSILTEQKVETDIERFLDNAESRAEIVILNQV